MKKIIGAVFALLILSTSVGAQTSKLEPAQCSQYFDQSQFEVDIWADFVTYEAGDPVLFEGSIKNNSNYSFKNATLLARISKTIDENGNSIILDEFTLLDKITLDSKKEIEIDASYVIPLNYRSGDYSVTFFLLESEQYDIAGVSYTNDISAKTINFEVKGTQEGYVYLDSSDIKVNEALFDTREYYSVLDTQTPISITVPIVNSSEESKFVNLKYIVYKNDFVSEKNKIEEASEEIELSPGDSFKKTIVVDGAGHGSYFVVFETNVANEFDPEIKTENSQVQIRFLTTTLDAKISLVELNKETSQFLICTQAFGSPVVSEEEMDQEGVTEEEPKGAIEFTIMDKNKKILTQERLEGLLSELDGGYLTSLGSKIKSDIFVHTKVYTDEDVLIDEIVKEYSCEDISNNCKSSSIIVQILVLISLLIIGAFIYKHKKLIK